jgi:hypothetical protein
MLRHAGFSKDSVCLVEFDKAIDVEDRKEFSIYIEAKKT